MSELMVTMIQMREWYIHMKRLPSRKGCKVFWLECAGANYRYLQSKKLSLLADDSHQTRDAFRSLDCDWLLCVGDRLRAAGRCSIGDMDTESVAAFFGLANSAVPLLVNENIPAYRDASFV